MCMTFQVERVERLPHGAKVLVEGAGLPHGPVVIWIDESVPDDQAVILADQASAEFYELMRDS